MRHTSSIPISIIEAAKCSGIFRNLQWLAESDLHEVHYQLTESFVARVRASSDDIIPVLTTQSTVCSALLSVVGQHEFFEKMATLFENYAAEMQKEVFSHE